jgi:Fe2+ transport system protein FeoA
MEWRNARIFMSTINILQTSRMPLTGASPGRKLKIVLVDGHPSTKAYLGQLGLLDCSLIEVVHRSASGPVMISVRGSRLALGRELARMIFVEEVEMV